MNTYINWSPNHLPQDLRVPSSPPYYTITCDSEISHSFVLTLKSISKGESYPPLKISFRRLVIPPPAPEYIFLFYYKFI